jgi:hypothetical protein
MDAYHKSDLFLKDARENAQNRGYDPDKLSIATDGIHKLTYDSPNGIRHFGRRGYGDYLYYSRYEPQIAKRKRIVFRRSHGAISRIYQLDKYSPNELAINILW